ncbi:hypothetical protein [Methanococcoides sp. AM1]|uniref:hypothetical protein n=1 Tax=Methanococcoides sp. AM1 TaxID=1201011 RepID=UPI001082B371|nr:hypothetical protein [Methanococcoides sp. AM1]
MSKNVKEFTWSKKKLEVAKAISKGTQTHGDIAEAFDITQETISRWKQHPEFLEKIDEFTLSHELATKAGLLRECYKGLDLKIDKIEGDKTTHLDYVKQIAEIQGHKKQKVEHSGSVEHTGGVVVYLPDNGREEKGDE